jgi:hypothetical protein
VQRRDAAAFLAFFEFAAAAALNVRILKTPFAVEDPAHRVMQHIKQHSDLTANAAKNISMRTKPDA